MPTYEVTYQDGRNIRVIAPDEEAAKNHANYQEMTRATVSARIGAKLDPHLSMAIFAKETTEKGQC